MKALFGFEILRSWLGSFSNNNFVQLFLQPYFDLIWNMPKKF